MLPSLLECLRTQTYRNLDVLISVDNSDQASADACRPFLERDARFRMEIQPNRLGWAGNTDWTMHARKGDFYIYQQHDDLISPSYVADLVDGAQRFPDAAICYAKMEFMGEERAPPSLVGDRMTRLVTYLRRLDFEPLRGLIRGSALDRTDGLLLSDFDPFDSFGTEFRFMTELALIGEFRLIDGPTYFKSWHGENLSFKRKAWSVEHRIAAKACWAAWMIEVVAPAGGSVEERRRLFMLTLERFAGKPEPWGGLRATMRKLLSDAAKLPLLRALREEARKSKKLAAAAEKLDTAVLGKTPKQNRPLMLEQILQRLKRHGRFDPACLGMTWGELERQTLRHYRLTSA
jgi:hypothetical protein